MTARESAMEALRETESKIRADREAEALRGACLECAAKDAEISQLKQENARLIRAESRQWYGSPAFQTYVDLKYGIVGDVLTALQDGRITCGKAAECLAEIAHGATEVSLPDQETTAIRI